MASSTGRSNRFGLGRYFGLETVRPTKPDAGAIFDYWRDTVANQPQDEMNLVEDVDNRIWYNRYMHYTSEYKIGQFVLRRGFPFDLKIKLKKDYVKERDDIRLVFQFGKKPKISDNTEVQLHLDDNEVVNGWCASVVNVEGPEVKVKVTSPPDCYVGKWSLKVINVRVDGDSVTVKRYNHDTPIYVIFNPWCKEDTVYLEDDRLRKEYVLNETGCIFIGSSRRIDSRRWVFGQFEPVVLDCALYLLDDKSDMKVKVRGNAVNICRKITALVNSQGDDGVLTGNWSGEYADGTSPGSWTGSVSILEEYMQTKSPVRFGQCWVFSGIVTTICRSLGIPCRSTTNFASAHDTDGSITIDTYVDEDGEILEDLGGDSIWNFHVWNDVWMRRPDLPGGHDGFQAIDATPQELSDGVFCMGPMSLKAIKEGNVTLPYDGSFVYSEVNGDRVFYIRVKGEKEGKHRFVPITTDEQIVGQSISTKEPGTFNREDVTHQYKYPEGSDENSKAAERAHIHSDTAKHVEDDKPYELKFNVTKPSAYLGDPIKLEFSVKNDSKEVRHLKGKIHVTSTYYTGHIKAHIVNIPYDAVEFQPGEVKPFTHEVSYEKYYSSLTDFCGVRISMFLHVEETGQNFSYINNFELEKPYMKIKAPEECLVGESVTVDVTFINPLTSTLTGCELAIEGPGLQSSRSIPQNIVAARGTFNGTFSITPVRHGTKDLVVIFNSDQICNINDSVAIKVNKIPGTEPDPEHE